MSPHARTVVTEDGTEMQIERDPRPLPLPDSKDLSALKRSLRANPNINLTGAAIDTAVGMFIDLPKVIRIATHQSGIDGLSSQYAGSTHLFMLEGEADAEAPSYPLGNPRLGDLLHGVPKGPRITGVRDEDGCLQAQLVVEFDSVADAESLVESTVRGTLQDPGANYSDSILGHGVMTPVEAVLVEVRFADGSPSLHVAALYDGTSRVTSAALVRYRESTDPAQNVARAAQELRRALTTPSRKRRAAYLKEAEAANLAYVRDGLTMPVLRQLQARRVPVRLIVGAQFSDENNLAELPAAITAAQSTRHISVNPWREAAKDTVTAQRTVLHLRQADQVAESFVHLIEDRPLDDKQVEELFPGADPELVTDPATGRARPLWRAAVIVHTLTDPEVHKEAKRFIRSDQGIAMVHPHRYAGFVGVLVDLPWRWAKPQTTDTARNAWRNGGVLSDGILKDDWEPLFESIEELVRLADDGNVSARLTLQVLAGTALLADGILTRDRGSKIGEDGVTYRATPPVLLASWADTRHGRLQAIRIVRGFNPTRAGGSGTGRAIKVDYTYPLVDEKGDPVRSGESHRVLIEGDLFDQANPEKAAEGREEINEAQRKRDAQKGHKPSREQLNEQRRFMIVENIGRAGTTVQQLEAEIPDYPSKLSEHPFGKRADWQLMRKRINDLGESLITVMPPADPEPPLFDDPEEKEETPEQEEEK
ncbi:hypothetical protein SAMN05216275_1138 [Streptosporangium canum]|uniref:Uncharacterized protein n=1 Tax=Streptosporangium canum TaxID=324952 RepID=A0A1I3UKR8_9ACTN|nr:hypothetical protein [Streptosporangium canum]SFJ84084.1 hypothetical protein SAMN05216275_1138 [Streptosporangium canum]